jgi:hypothetical protein
MIPVLSRSAQYKLIQNKKTKHSGAFFHVVLWSDCGKLKLILLMPLLYFVLCYRFAVVFGYLELISVLG